MALSRLRQVPMLNNILSFLSILGRLTLPQADASKFFYEPNAEELARAACKGDLKAMHKAIDKGANVNWRSDGGATPLMWAVSCNNIDGVKELVRLGADVNLKGYRGISPATRATHLSSIEILEFLVENGADLAGDTRYELSNPLMQAADYGVDSGNWDAYDYILKQDIDINKEYQSLTIASIFVGYGRFNRIIQLLELGYDNDLEKLKRVVNSRYNAPDGEDAKQKLLTKIDEKINN